MNRQVSAGNRFLKILKTAWLPSSLILWVSLCISLIYSIYSEVKRKTEEHLEEELAALAEQAALGIENQFSHMLRDLSLMAQDDSIISMTDQGKAEMDRYLRIHADQVQSVTRVGANGTILFTVLDQKSIGKDISFQSHVREVLEKKIPVLSDVFTAVQGYRSVALHVPVFKADEFAGSIALLIPFDLLAKRYLEGIRAGKSGYAWVISSKGTEIYSPVADRIGRPVAETTGASPSITGLVEAMTRGERGAIVLSQDPASGKATTTYAAYMPISIANTFWSIAVAASENEILTAMRGFMNRWLITIVLLAGGLAGFLISLVRVSAAAKEKQVREEGERKYRSLVEQLPAINYIVDFRSKPRSVYISPQVKSILGFSQEEWLAEPDLWIRQIHPDDRERVVSEVRQCDQRGEPIDLEYRALTRDGSVRWIHNRNMLVRHPSGRILSANGVMFDITERRLAEEALRQKEELYRTLVTTSPFAITMTDLSSRIVFCNRQAAQMHGALREEELFGKDAMELIAPEDRPRAAENALKTAEQGSVRNVEYIFLRKDGSRFPGELNASLVADENGKPRNFIAVVQDITSRKEAEKVIREREEKLLQSQKMEAVGRLAGGVAHDFNNLLTVISGYADLILLAPGPAAPWKSEIQEIKQAAQRAGTLTNQLLAFSRKQVRKPEVLNVNEQVRSMGTMLHRLIGENIQLRTKLNPELGSVRADPGQIEQVVMNLAVNAKDAMTDGGELDIETLNVDFPKGSALPWPEMLAGPYVLLRVSDTGKGMDAETLSHLFEPFFTTKEMGKGTGLGLSIVYGIIKQNGGYIFPKSAPGLGSSFEIYLPRVAEEAAHAKEAAPPAPVYSGSERILLAEDEDQVRNLARTILTRAGYTVLEARNGKEALKACEAFTGTIDMLVTDMVMPEMGGRKLGEKISELYPRIKIIYMSGYTDDAIDSQGMRNKGIYFIHKPFNANELLEIVRKALVDTENSGPTGT